jgi:hypothetical protein
MYCYTFVCTDKWLYWDVEFWGSSRSFWGTLLRYGDTWYQAPLDTWGRPINPINQEVRWAGETSCRAFNLVDSTSLMQNQRASTISHYQVCRRVVDDVYVIAPLRLL